MRLVAPLILFTLAACTSGPSVVDNSTNQATGSATTASAGSPAGLQPSGNKITCKTKDEARTITSREVAGGGCEVLYEKDGQSDVVTFAKAGTNHCDRVLERMRSNLTTSGFSCEEPSPRVSQLPTN